MSNVRKKNNGKKVESDIRLPMCNTHNRRCLFEEYKKKVCSSNVHIIVILLSRRPERRTRVKKKKEKREKKNKEKNRGMIKKEKMKAVIKYY